MVHMLKEKVFLSFFLPKERIKEVFASLCITQRPTWTKLQLHWASGLAALISQPENNVGILKNNKSFNLHGVVAFAVFGLKIGLGFSLKSDKSSLGFNEFSVLKGIFVN